MHRFIDQLNVSITTNRTCTLRCKHCYISPELFSDKQQITIDLYKLIFDRIEELIQHDNNLKEVEWEAIGGETTMMPFEFWEEMLPWTLDRIEKINAQLENPGSLNFLTNLIYVDQRYTDLFNQYGDHKAFCLYTSWEPDTDRFGSRNQLYNRWKTTLGKIKSSKKILDIILTKKVIEIGAKHLIDEFVPLGVTDFSIKMLSPYGSGKAFFSPNMTDFESMRDFLIDLDKFKPEGVTFTPQEEMLSSIYRGTSFQCNGNFKYDLSIEPDGSTHFNANQTGAEAAIGSRLIRITDNNWARKVMLENKTEENAKLTLDHPECYQCKYMSYCNGGWYHYKVEDPQTIQAYSNNECPGYYKFWEYNEEKIRVWHSRSLANHKASLKRALSGLEDENNSKDRVKHTKLSELSGDYEHFVSAIDSSYYIYCDRPRLYGKNLLELCWFFDDIRAKFVIPLDVILVFEHANELILHYIYRNWSTIRISSEDVWAWVTSNPNEKASKLILEAAAVFHSRSIEKSLSCRTVDESILVVDDRNDELFRWIYANPPKNILSDKIIITKDQSKYLDTLISYLRREEGVRESLS